MVIPLDDGPFARVEGVKTSKLGSSQGSRNKSRDNVPSFYTGSTVVDGADVAFFKSGTAKGQWIARLIGKRGRRLSCLILCS